jgi:hypothetical protein
MAEALQTFEVEIQCHGMPTRVLKLSVGTRQLQIPRVVDPYALVPKFNTKLLEFRGRHNADGLEIWE